MQGHVDAPAAGTGVARDDVSVEGIGKSCRQADSHTGRAGHGFAVGGDLVRSDAAHEFQKPYPSHAGQMMVGGCSAADTAACHYLVRLVIDVSYGAIRYGGG